MPQRLGDSHAWMESLGGIVIEAGEGDRLSGPPNSYGNDGVE